MDITFENFKIDESYITRIHGINAFDELISVQNLSNRHQELVNQAEAETIHDKFQNAGATDSKVKSVKEQSFRHLSKAVILYQSSMESIIALAESHDSTLEENLSGVNGFKNRWETALNYFNESPIEFQKYESEFYKDLRIPLTHLAPNKDQRLYQIKQLSFRKVYNGFRLGWWSYLRILRGLGLQGDDFDGNWKYICHRGLEPELFLEDHPDNLN